MADIDKYIVRNNFKSKFVARLRNMVKFHSGNDIKNIPDDTKVLEDVDAPIYNKISDNK
jgi:hypothetical protein